MWRTDRDDKEIMFQKTILLVEDHVDDEELTIRALKKNNVTNDLVAARDGVEALDFLVGTGAYTGRDTVMFPGLVVLDLKRPKVEGREVRRRIGADPRTRRTPVTMPTSSREEQDLIKSYDLGTHSNIREPGQFDQFTAAVRQLGLYWLILNEVSPC
jgi:two-component system, response regulator